MKTVKNKYAFVINSDNTISYPRLNFFSKTKEGEVLTLSADDFKKNGTLKVATSNTIEAHYLAVSDHYSKIMEKMNTVHFQIKIKKMIQEGTLTVTADNFHIATKATYKKVDVDFDSLLLEAKENNLYYYEQKNSSSYVIKDGVVFRSSDHWMGKECDTVSSCRWTIDNDTSDNYTTIVGACPLDDFTFEMSSVANVQKIKQYTGVTE